MEVNKDVQQSILETIKEQLNPAISLVDELADCLDISKDSAYRRIRGEKMFDIEEIKLITLKYDLSLDRIFNHEKSTVTFNSQAINLTDFTFEKYLESVLNNLSLIVGLDNKELLYSARDIPIFHYFQFRELAAFKVYFWLKSYLNDPSLSEERFLLEQLPSQLHRLIGLGEKIWKAYRLLPSTEIWSHETANISLRQIQYYHENGMLSNEDAQVLCTQFGQMLDHIKLQAEYSSKLNLGQDVESSVVDYKIYLSEVAIGDNAILFKMGSKKISFLSFNSLSYLSTSDENFCNLIDDNFQNLTRKSVLISATSEKSRNRFFNNAMEKLASLESNLSYSQERKAI